MVLWLLTSLLSAVCKVRDLEIAASPPPDLRDVSRDRQCEGFFFSCSLIGGCLCVFVSPALMLPPLVPHRRIDRGRWPWREQRRRSHWRMPAGSAAPPTPAEPSPGQETMGKNRKNRHHQNQTGNWTALRVGLDYVRLNFIDLCGESRSMQQQEGNRKPQRKQTRANIGK